MSRFGVSAVCILGLVVCVCLAGAALLIIDSPLEGWNYLSGAPVWLSVRLELESALFSKLGQAGSAYELCAQLDGAAPDCVSALQSANLPIWSNLEDGNHNVCVWLQDNGEDARARGHRSAESPEACSTESSEALPRAYVAFGSGADTLVDTKRVLGVKYGQHGDDSSVYLSVDGMVRWKRDLSDVWPDAWTEQRRIHAGGFCGACAGDGASLLATVTRAGVCDVCVPFSDLVNQWTVVLNALGDVDDLEAVVVSSPPEDCAKNRAPCAIKEPLLRRAALSFTPPPRSWA
mmetsp:Transcript_19633/g.66364  ORF Transcript_19633/g.66364 Transcript_19633/m.66364 type:complete len:290 (+) Transcript_19633:75-944(+)